MTEALAVVGRLNHIHPHPNADRIEIITIGVQEDGPLIDLVSGKHYRAGDMGVYLRPGAVIPGWLARQLWLPVVDNTFTIRDMPIRGVQSPGLWAGSWWRNDSSVPTSLNAKTRAQGGWTEVDGWIGWERWNPSWKLGDDVSAALGIMPA